MIKVVVIDSDEEMLASLEQELTAKGYNVQTFSNPVAAKKYLFQTTDVPDLIILDIMIPDMDGLCLLHEIHSTEKTSSVPIIAASTIANANALFDVFIFGATDYAIKPFDINTLDMKIKRSIETTQKRTSNY